MEFENKNLNDLYQKIKEEKELTIIKIGEMMAMTSKQYLLMNRIEKGSNYNGETLDLIFKLGSRKRKLYIISISQKDLDSTLLFKGNREDIKTDFDVVGIKRGNALLNLAHEADDIKKIVEEENLNSNVKREYLLSVGENNNQEVPVYPEIETSHAVMNKIKIES